MIVDWGSKKTYTGRCDVTVDLLEDGISSLTSKDRILRTVFLAKFSEFS
jgi:hypothetical protein